MLFGRSDHDHLGKLMAYLKLSRAKVGMWICEEPKPEHVEIISWLNDSLRGISLYLIKLDVIRIDESPPAPLLKVLACLRAKIEEIRDRYTIREEFWRMHLGKSKRKTNLFARISPPTDCYVAALLLSGTTSKTSTSDSLRAVFATKLP